MSQQFSHEKPRSPDRTVCNEQLANQRRLSEGSDSHAGDKMYSCTECQKCFLTKKYLSRHMNIHTSRYKCSECGMCFREKNALTEHRRIHSEKKPFECSVCGKRFTEAGSLTVHSRIHSGEKPYIMSQQSGDLGFSCENFLTGFCTPNIIKIG